jgi:hypothetical protein
MRFDLPSRECRDMSCDSTCAVGLKCVIDPATCTECKGDMLQFATGESPANCECKNSGTKFDGTDCVCPISIMTIRDGKCQCAAGEWFKDIPPTQMCEPCHETCGECKGAGRDKCTECAAALLKSSETTEIFSCECVEVGKVYNTLKKICECPD